MSVSLAVPAGPLAVRPLLCFLWGGWYHLLHIDVPQPSRGLLSPSSREKPLCAAMAPETSLVYTEGTATSGSYHYWVCSRMMNEAHDPLDSNSLCHTVVAHRLRYAQRLAHSMKSSATAAVLPWTSSGPEWKGCLSGGYRPVWGWGSAATRQPRHRWGYKPASQLCQYYPNICLEGFLVCRYRFLITSIIHIMDFGHPIV